VILNGILGALAAASLALVLWQWLAARRFPLHRRIGARQRTPEGDESYPGPEFQPGVTLLKPLKGCEAHTGSCLRSWFEQDYAGALQILFAVSNARDPVCAVVESLCREFPNHDARLVVCPERLGANAKVSKLAQLEPLASHETIVVSDADVCAPPDLLANAVLPLRQPEIGLVTCFYRLANPATLAMRWEAVAINADFWSQVLQGASFRRLDFALGAVMAMRRSTLTAIGGFCVLVDCLADDYQLGNRIARGGHRIELCSVVVECRLDAVGWGAVWRHQLRWARTIRVCQPLPYFLSLLSNATFWPLIWLAATPSARTLAASAFCLAIRCGVAADLQTRLTRVRDNLQWLWLVPVKDLLQVALWACAFAGNGIKWRGERYRLRRDGTLERR